MAAMGQEIVRGMEQTALAFTEIEKTTKYRNQTGQVRFVNRGTRRGCAVTKSTTATRNLTFEEGELFANGRVYFLPQRINGAAVPSNNTAAPATCVAFARVTATGIELDVSNLGSNAPADAIPLYRISVPAGNNSGSDQYLAAVTLTDVRRIEPDYPLMLASPQPRWCSGHSRSRSGIWAGSSPSTWSAAQGMPQHTMYWSANGPAMVPA